MDLVAQEEGLTQMGGGRQGGGRRPAVAEAEGTLLVEQAHLPGEHQPFWNRYYQKMKVRNMSTCLTAQQVLV